MPIQLLVIIALAVLVVLVAYALGTYLRRRQEGVPDAPPPPARRGSSASRAIGDREVRVVVDWLLSQAFEQTGVKVADDKIAFQRIVEAADKAVRELKTQNVVTVSLPYLTADATGPKHLEARLTREMIQELVKY
jgi:hypothetical protein